MPRCSAPLCAALRRTALRCPALRRAALRCAALPFAALRCPALHCIGFHLHTGMSRCATWRHADAHETRTSARPELVGHTDAIWSLDVHPHLPYLVRPSAARRESREVARQRAAGRSSAQRSTRVRAGALARRRAGTHCLPATLALACRPAPVRTEASASGAWRRLHPPPPCHSAPVSLYLLSSCSLSRFISFHVPIYESLGTLEYPSIHLEILLVPLYPPDGPVFTNIHPHLSIQDERDVRCLALVNVCLQNAVFQTG